MRYDTVIGLETHVQLLTRTKMFCGCRNVYGAPPNTHTCPVCLGLPGALPVANREAFTLAIRVGLALGCEIGRFTKFDRKNYFYPDLPKGYQISQLDFPINGRGRLELTLSGNGGAVGIERAHLEEDAAKNTHTAGGTLVDLNRCGIPLLEIVTRPDITSPQMAWDYLTELKLILRYLGVSDCDMEKGSLRVDVNVSLKPKGRAELGTKVELKNLNSFKMVRRALEHEQIRQAAVLDAAGAVDEETRLWDDERGETRTMRKKEGQADYRYFPDPDLPPARIAESWIDEVRASMPELPGARQRRLVDAFGLSAYDAGVLIQEPEVADYFEAAAHACGDPKQACNWITGEVFSTLNETGLAITDLAVTPELLADLIALTRDGTLNVASARQVFHAIKDTGEDPRAKAQEMGLVQVSDAAELETVVRTAMSANEKAVADVRGGNAKAAGAIVGHVMRETKGRANPRLVNEILTRLLAEEE